MNTNKEIWLPVKGYKGLYEVSNFGNIKALEVVRVCPTKKMAMKEKLLKQSKHRQGYLCVGLSKSGIRKGYLVHRIVAISFIKNPDNLPEVNHKDAIKSNNFCSNLEWSTRVDNQHHAIELGLTVNYKGEEHGSAILSEKEVLKIRELYKLNGDGRSYRKKYSCQKLSDMFGISAASIHKIISRESWKHI